MMIPKGRKPSGPGVFIKEFILDGRKMTQGQLAKALHVRRETVSRIVNEHSSVTAVMAMKLAKVTGTTPELWLNAQRSVDLWKAQKDHAEEIEELAPLQDAV